MSKRLVAIVLLAVWLVLTLASVVLCDLTKTLSDSPYQQVMLDASNLAQRAFDEVKTYKVSNGISLASEDKLQTGVLGKHLSLIVTTDGMLEAKRTSVNPNWAAVIVSMFVKAKLKQGDQVLMVFSGSFPALNLCAMAAGQAYGLDMCLMGSVGASHYGATDEDFNFFDMTEHLYSKGVFNDRLDLVSLGGVKDVGDNFGKIMYMDYGIDSALEDGEIVRNQIKERIANSGVDYLEEPNFQDNMAYRMDYLKKHAPNVKFVLNVGGSMVGLGVGLSAYVDTGYAAPGFLVSNGLLVDDDPNFGLVQRYLNKGIPVASLLNLRLLADTYGIAYDPDVKPTVDVSASNVYYAVKYNPIIPIVAILLMATASVLFCVLRVRKSIEVKENERNHILRGR